MIPRERETAHRGVDDLAQAELESKRPTVETVSRFSRKANFRQQVLFAYGNRCSISRIQLKLVEAAHILPVGAPRSTDQVTNGIALSPTYHRAYDSGIIYLDEDYQMRLNLRKVSELEAVGHTGGLEEFRAPLGKILLPPDQNQWPRPEFIRLANKFRLIA